MPACAPATSLCFPRLSAVDVRARIHSKGQKGFRHSEGGLTVADDRYERATRELAKVLDIPISPAVDSKRAKWGDAYATLAQHAHSYSVPIPASVTDIINGRA